MTVYCRVVKSGWREPYGTSLHVSGRDWRLFGPRGTGHLARLRAPIDATVSAKRAAVTLGVDLTTVQGTGADGRITKRDVERAAANDTDS